MNHDTPVSGCKTDKFVIANFLKKKILKTISIPDLRYLYRLSENKKL